MPKAARKSDHYSCKCVSLHTYPAYVYGDSWNVFLHVCHCGREHINESLLPEPTTPAKPPQRRPQLSKRR